MHFVTKESCYADGSGRSNELPALIAVNARQTTSVLARSLGPSAEPAKPQTLVEARRLRHTAAMNENSESLPLESLSAELGRHLADAGLMLAAAESCTGGWIAKSVTDIAGSSGWFDRGFVTYSDDAKRDMLGVPAETLETWGAVSEQVVREMALGALAHSTARVAVAVSGIAGPGGGSLDKPVGTVCFGFALRGRLTTETLRFHGDRDAVRRQSVSHALRRLIGLLVTEMSSDS